MSSTTNSTSDFDLNTNPDFDGGFGPDGFIDLPKVAIIGRPNVGKSTLFNIITDTRKAVVKNQSGVTRDIQVQPVNIWGKQFDLMDTGGVTEADDLFSKLIKEQVTDFLFSVDFIVFFQFIG